MTKHPSATELDASVQNILTQLFMWQRWFPAIPIIDEARAQNWSKTSTLLDR